MADFNHIIMTSIYMTDCPTNCPYVGRITTLEAQHNLLTPLVNKIDSKMDQVIVSLGKIEVIELKHATHTEALDRAFKRIEDNEKQLEATTVIVRDVLSQLKGMMRVAIVLWTIFGGALGFILTRVIQ